MWNRRNFIKAGALTAMSAYMQPKLFASSQAVDELVILHTNDVHSHIEPFSDDDKKYPGMGGIAPRKSIIDAIRDKHKHTLLLDAGDIFQGTPYFNFFHGSIEIEAMNKMGYDCATIGNHDFDGGLDNLALQISHAKFPFVNCNYDFSNTPLAGKINKHVVLQKGKLKIGITGVGVELDGLVPAQLFGNTVYNNPIEAVQKEAAILKYDHKCNLIICLSHLGYKYEDSKVSDLVLGASTSNIDLIIGGHTHTFLPEPVVIKNKKNEDVIINQVGWAGVQLGQLNYLFEKKLRKKIANTHTVVEIKKSSVK